MKKNKIFYSPAKVNFFLKIFSKQKDGFHKVKTLCQTIDLFDIIKIEESDKDTIILENEKFIPNNIIYNAIKFFRKKSGIKNYFKIFLQKNIPIEAGLAGGSGNAATVLWALNKYFHKNNNFFSKENLFSIAKELGFDIPFFFSSGSAICEGKGERVESFIKKNFSFTIATPNFGMSTKEVYQSVKIEDLKDKNFDLEIENLKKNKSFCFFNDLEYFAFKLCPKLFHIKKELLASGFNQVCMSGSGSSFFCFGKNNKKVDNVKFYTVKTINRLKNSWYG